MGRLARLTAEAIDVGVALVTLPARWAANGLRWLADQSEGESTSDQKGGRSGPTE